MKRYEAVGIDFLMMLTQRQGAENGKLKTDVMIHAMTLLIDNDTSHSRMGQFRCWCESNVSRRRLLAGIFFVDALL